MSETREWWTAIRATAFFAAAGQAETEPDTVDPVTIELADWAEHREQLGLGSHDTGDFIGLGDDRSGLPSWPASGRAARPRADVDGNLRH